MKYTAVLFDLDGTLLDTLDDLADSANVTLRRRGWPEHPPEAYKTFVGDGVTTLLRRCLPEEHRDEQTVAECVAEMRAEYAERWDAKTRPYDGIVEMLEQLHARGLKLAVLSNKPHDATKKCVDRFFGHISFACVQGVDDGIPPKPDPAGTNHIRQTLATAPEKFLYLGDTNTDMKTAVAAGMRPVGVTWGFRTPEELRANGARTLIDHPRELFTLLD
jgi:phosphoglycolate phosphatase